MNGEEAKKRLEIWLKCGECPEDKRCYDSYLHSTCEYTDYCDDVSIGESIKVAIEALEQVSCLTDRPCSVCRFKTENGCNRLECVFKGV